MKNRILVSLFLNTQEVLRCLNIKCNLDRNADWQVIKKYPFGTLAFDCEEGLKIETNPDKVKECVSFLRKFMTDYKVAYFINHKKYGKMHNINAKFCSYTTGDKEPQDKVLTDAGFVLSMNEYIHVLTDNK